MPERANMRTNRGFTLTELAIVLAIVGVVLGAVWAVAATVWTNYQMRTANNQIMTVVQNIRDYYDPRGGLPCAANNCTGQDITATCDAANLFPIEMRATPGAAGNNSSVNHALANLATGSFHVNALGGASRDIIEIHVGGLSHEKCTKLLINFPLFSPALGVNRITRGGNTMAITATGTPLDVPTAVSWCANNNTNEVILEFRLRN